MTAFGGSDTITALIAKQVLGEDSTPALSFAMSRVERPLEGAGGTIAELRLVADALDALPDQPSEAMEQTAGC